MIDIVKSIDGFHENHVSDAVIVLQFIGYNVTKIERIKKMFLWIGEDITHIHYEKSK